MGWFLLQNACDPCYSLAQKICDCLPPNERSACMSNLSTANQHSGLELAKNPAICEEALKPGVCRCSDFLARRNYEKCGLNRVDN